jgi:hypothetical protein
MMVPPGFTKLGDPVLLITRSAWALTVVLAVAELFVGTLSDASLETSAVLFSTVPVATADATLVTIVAVAEVFAASSGMSIVMLPLGAKQPPLVVVHESTVSPTGKEFVTDTFIASSGPALLTVIV